MSRFIKRGNCTTLQRNLILVDKELDRFQDEKKSKQKYQQLGAFSYHSEGKRLVCTDQSGLWSLAHFNFFALFPRNSFLPKSCTFKAQIVRFSGKWKVVFVVFPVVLAQELHPCNYGDEMKVWSCCVLEGRKNCILRFSPLFTLARNINKSEFSTGIRS